MKEAVVVVHTNIKDGVIVFAYETEFPLFEGGQGTCSYGAEDISFPPGAKDAFPQGFRVDFLTTPVSPHDQGKKRGDKTLLWGVLLEVDDFGDPAGENVQVGGGVTSREIIPAKDFEEGFFDEGGVD